jgi:hypothetical protein
MTVWRRTGLCALALLATGCSVESSAPSGPVDARFSFADCQGTWPTANDPGGGRVGCRKGAYEIVATSAHPETSRVDYGPAQPRVALAVRVAADPLQAAQGVGCWRDPANGYLFLAGTDGSFEILRASRTDLRGLKTLATGYDPGAAWADDRTTYQVSCAAGGAGTVLAFRIGGRQVARITDHRGLRGFTRAGFAVFDAQPSPATVRFDDLRVSTPGIAAGGSDRVATPSRLLNETFASAKLWFTGTDSGVAGRVAGGRYALSIVRGNQVIEPAVGLSQQGESLYVIGKLRVAGSADAAGGVTCYAGSSGTTGWGFVLHPGGHYAIVRIADDSELASGELPGPGSKADVRLGGWCEHQHDGMHLGLDVDGVRLVQTVDSQGAGPLTQTGVYLFGTRGASASFDALEAAEVGLPS